MRRILPSAPGVRWALFPMFLLLCGPAAADEAAVRRASDALVQAWNRHDVKAWSSFLTEDVWYTETRDAWERMKGRDKAVEVFAANVQTSDLAWRIVRVHTRPDGVVGVVLAQQVSYLPKTGGTYKAVFTSDPSYARWRREPDGRWRLAYFTSHKGTALAAMKEDDDLPHVASAVAPPAPAVRSKPPPAPGTGEPAAYTAFWGRYAQGCNYCHGRPPALPSSESGSRIVAVGAAQPSGAALRMAMQRHGLGGTMDTVLADPALTDAELDAVRRYLIDVRDGGSPATVESVAPGAVRHVELRNERSSRDPPARIAELRIDGPFLIDAQASTCRIGKPLPGQTACRVALRTASDHTAAASVGTLIWRLAPAQGLEPQPRRVQLRDGR